MERKTFTCDVCGVIKGSSNHWYRVRVGDAFHVYHWEFFGEGREDTSVPVFHVCGHACAIRKLSEFMGVPQ